MAYEKVTLPYYTKKEEIINSTTHALGVVIGIAAMIICAQKAASLSAIIGSAVFAFSTVFLYLSSTLYHTITKEKLKKIFRLIDHSVIYALISGTIISISIIAFSGQNSLILIASVSFCFILSTTGIALTFIDHEKYKKVQMILYMVLGWGAAALAYPLYLYCKNFWTVIMLIAVGGIVYTVGTVFYVLGKKKRYFHSIFHIFVLAGTVLHLIGIYYAL